MGIAEANFQIMINTSSEISQRLRAVMFFVQWSMNHQGLCWNVHCVANVGLRKRINLCKRGFKIYDLVSILSASLVTRALDMYYLSFQKSFQKSHLKNYQLWTNYIYIHAFFIVFFDFFYFVTTVVGTLHYNLCCVKISLGSCRVKIRVLKYA